MIAVIHAGAGAFAPDERHDDYREALTQALQRAREVLERNGSALDAAQAAVMFMEDEVDFFNAGRGATLCNDGTVELSAAVMRGSDRAAGAVAAVDRSRYPVQAARAVLDRSAHVLLIGAAADRYAAEAGVEQREPTYFITERQQRRLRDAEPVFDHDTVGAVCLDADGALAAATSTGGRRGQLPGRVGDSPLIGAGTWADDVVAISCTGEGEAFIRAGAARQIAALIHGGSQLDAAAEQVLDDVAALGGKGGLIALDRRGQVAMPVSTPAMPRGVWRSGEAPTVWI